MVKRILIYLLLVFLPLKASAQKWQTMDGKKVGSNPTGQLSLKISLQGKILQLEGYVDRWIDQKTLEVTEFQIIDLETGTKIIEYGAAHQCTVKASRRRVTVTEMYHLRIPTKKGWVWKQVPLEEQMIIVSKDVVDISQSKLVLKPPKLSKKVVKELEEQIMKYHKIGLKKIYEQEADPYKSDFYLKLDDLVGKLLVAALGGHQLARNAFLNFKYYFSYPLDLSGAMSIQWLSDWSVYKAYTEGGSVGDWYEKGYDRLDELINGEWKGVRE